MKDISKIEEYVTAFTDRLGSRLTAGIGTKTIVHPVDTEGAVIEVLLEKGADGEIQYLAPAETVNKAVSSIKQNLISGDISGITFRGTNISMQDNRIVLIKGGDANDEWNGASAIYDVHRVLHLSEGGE